MKTGIQKLDELFGSELKKNLLVYAKPGVDDVPFAQNILVNCIEHGENGIYVVNNKRPEAVKSMIKFLYKDPDSFKDKMGFMDCYSCLTEIKTIDTVSGADFLDKKRFLGEMEDQSAKKISIVFIDSVSTFLDMGANDEDTLNKVRELINALNLQGVFTISLFVDWGYDKEIVARMKDIFENIVELRPVERNIILSSYFNVSKKFGEKNGKLEFPFKVLKPGGVRIFIPKILVTGPYHAGKTSFIHSASTRAVSVNRIGTTIALDFGHVDLGGFAVDLFGTPGQERFDPILELLAGESLGVVLVIDATQPETFERAAEMIAKTRTTGLPIVIAANKADLPGALTIDGIKKRMRLPADIIVLPLIAEHAAVAKEGEPCRLNSKDISKIMESLLGQVI